MDIATYLREIYIPSRIGLSPQSAQQIQFAARGLQCDIADLNEQTITTHLKQLQSRKLSPATINTRRAYLLGLWGHAFRKGYNQHDPRQAEVPRLVRYQRKPQAWSLDDLRKMLAAAWQIERRGCCAWSGPEWVALLLLLYYTGLRITAALSLKLDDLHGDLLRVPAEIQKDREELLFRLPSEVCELLRSLRRPSIARHGRCLAEYLLPWPWSLHDPQGKLTYHILRPAGLPLSRRLKFHAIRKTVATLVAVHAGKEAARSVLGHSSLAVTERYLADPQTVDPSLPGGLSPLDVLPRLEVNCAG